MEDLIKGINLSDIKIARGGDRVYKEECIYSFDTPESPEGLYISLHSLYGVGRQWLDLHYRKTGERLYLHIKRTVKPKLIKDAQMEGEEPPVKKPTRLAIGVEGGFSGGIEKVEYDEQFQLVICPGVVQISLPCPDLPAKIQDSITAIISAESASRQDQVTAWEEPLIITKHADNLQQLNNGVKIPPSGWKCELCDLTTNLWANLTDGRILCGRRYFDGSGGNNHAVDHYDNAKYPLAVKLGTITPGGADVYSYDEDSMVLDPKLAEHLAHFGINMMAMSKTDKTMTELEIDANIKIGEWSVIQESGQELKLVYGAGYTGLQNMGNTCYMNSLMQVLFTLPEFKSRYYERAVNTFQSVRNDPTKDFNTQMCKLAMGLLSGTYSQPPPVKDTSSAEVDTTLQKEQDGIRPAMFKTLIGTGHREFSSNRQQDVQEFFLHLFSIIDRTEHVSNGASNVVSYFRYQMEERIQCTVSGKVRYSVKPELLVTLPVPMAMATNHDQVVAWQQKKAQLLAEKKKINPEEIVRAKVPFEACLAQFSAPANISDFFSTALQTKSPATKTSRFKTFPDYLVLQLAKFAFDDNWVPVKYDVEVDVPEILNLSSLRAHGLQSGEEELPDVDDTSQEQALEIDQRIVVQLVDMGFDIEGCKKAVYNTNNQGAEAATNWIFEHMGDPDFSAPFVPPNTKSPSITSAVSEDGIVIIMGLGFSREQAIKALKSTDNNVERAADWVFSHMDELQEVGGADNDQKDNEQFRDGQGKYHLFAFISHMGTSSMTGHYVCHIWKEGRWIIFNDNKVAESVAPPKDLAYLYFYKRDKE